MQVGRKVRYEKVIDHEWKARMPCQRLCQFSIELDVARTRWVHRKHMIDTLPR